MMRRRIPLLLFVIVSVLSFVPVLAQDYEPEFEEIECFFDLPGVTCGLLYVPEDRDDPESFEIEIAVVIIPARNGNPEPDPVFYLEGGPGGSAISATQEFMEHPLRDNRDLILIDQRGAGFSYPSLNCWEMEVGESDDAVSDCYERLTDEGINLSAYNTQANAADINDLRITLGYDEINLYGISYGTRLALAMMRYHPEGIRSVVIDSVFPPEVNTQESLPIDNLRAFNALFSACAADDRCAFMYPTLEEDFYAMIEQFNNEPLVFEYMDGEDSYELEIYGETVIETLTQGMYDTDAIGLMPFGLQLLREATDDLDRSDAYDILQGFYSVQDWVQGFSEGGADDAIMESEFAQQVFEEIGDISDSEGMFSSVTCADEHPFEDYEAAYENAQELPEVLIDWGTFAVDGLKIECETWVVDPADPIEAERVISDIPTLLISGEFDPVTPPNYADSALEGLSNGQHIVFPTGGHGISGIPGCAADITTAYVNDPSAPLDTSCMASLTIDWYGE